MHGRRPGRTEVPADADRRGPVAPTTPLVERRDRDAVVVGHVSRSHQSFSACAVHGLPSFCRSRIGCKRPLAPIKTSTAAKGFTVDPSSNFDGRQGSTCATPPAAAAVRAARLNQPMGDHRHGRRGGGGGAAVGSSPRTRATAHSWRARRRRWRRSAAGSHVQFGEPVENLERQLRRNQPVVTPLVGGVASTRPPHPDHRPPRRWPVWSACQSGSADGQRARRKCAAGAVPGAVRFLAELRPLRGPARRAVKPLVPGWQKR
jgi:hypothetical protein